MTRGVAIALLVLLWILAFALATRWHDSDADLPHADPWNAP